MPKFFTKKTASKPSPQISSEKDREDFNLPEPALETETSLIKTYLSWTAPSRPYRKKDRSFYTTVAILVILLMLIALLAKEILLIGVLLSVAFVVYVLGFTPPEDVEYKISTQGITVDGHFYFWNYLDSFWFSEKEGQKLLNILTHLTFPGQLILVLGSTDEEKAKAVMVKHLPYHEIAPKNLLENWGNFLQKHFPLENPHR